MRPHCRAPYPESFTDSGNVYTKGQSPHITAHACPRTEVMGTLLLAARGPVHRLFHLTPLSIAELPCSPVRTAGTLVLSYGHLY